MELTGKLEEEYLDLWASCTIKSEFASLVKQCANNIQSNQVTYREVSDKTGIPWYVIAVIHSMESDFDFTTHLHNGDPLTSQTFHVPAGRPLRWNPPSSWTDSAIDALEFDGALGVQSWNLPNVFFFLEKFNGWGYRTGAGRKTTPSSRSPYIYSGTDHYQKGKYFEDSALNVQFDPDLVSDQVGCMAQLKELENRGLIKLSPDKVTRESVGTIAAWQHILNGCGYIPSILISGWLDDATIDTTKRFQVNLSLSVTGDVNLKTWQHGIDHAKLKGWSAVVPPLSKQSNPPPKTTSTDFERDIVGSIAAWQHILNGCGYIPTLIINGWTDDATLETTRKFQTNLGLPVTGNIDLKTWQAGMDHAKDSLWLPVIPDRQPTTIASGSITAQVYSFYSQPNNYDMVYDNVMGWYGTTSNGCVAFLSTALRLSGYDVPKTENSIGNISLFTAAFSQYLEDQGWNRSNNSDDLALGDIVLTDDGDFDDNIPMHVYVFAGWADKSNKVAWVIDNQDFTHERNIEEGGGGFNFTPFAYFLRA
jgi:lysozyme family protein